MSNFFNPNQEKISKDFRKVLDAMGDVPSIDELQPEELGIQVRQIPYPIEALPELIRGAVIEVQGYVKAPIAMVASCALGAVSLAAQAHANVARDASLVGPCSLFFNTVAESGERKSTCDRFFTTPVVKFEADQALKSNAAVTRWNADIEIWDAKRAGLKEKLRQLAKEAKPTASIEEELRSLEGRKPEAPRIPKLKWENTTPQALAAGLAKRWPSAGVMSAEAGMVFGSHAMNKDSVMESLSLLNTLWDGGEARYDRKSTDSFTLRGARLTMSLLVQEATLREFEIKNGELARGSGFHARFLMTWPDSTQGERLFTGAPDAWPGLDRFQSRMTELLEREPVFDKHGGLKPLVMQLSPTAKQRWVAYHDAVEVELRRGGQFADAKDAAAKSAENVARIACLFEIFQGLATDISLDSMERACSIGAWHLNESLRFFGLLALPRPLMDAARLDEWLLWKCRNTGAATVSRREAQRQGPVRDGARLDAALAELQSANRAFLLETGRQRNIAIHPALVRGSA